MEIFARLSGQRVILTGCEAVRGPVMREAMRSAMRKIGSVISRAAKTLVPVESGATKKSIGYRVYHIPKVGPKRFGVVVGPRRGFDVPVRQSAPRGKAPRGRIRRMTARQLAKGLRPDQIRKPTKIAHLIERGRKAVAAVKKKILLDESGDVIGKEAKAAAPKPFMAPAYEANKAAAVEILASELRRGFAKLFGGG